MSYMDEQGGRDKGYDERSLKSDKHKSAADLLTESSTTEQQTTTHKSAVPGSGTAGSGNSNNNSSSKPAKGLFSRLRDALTGGVEGTKNRAKKGFMNWKSEGSGMASGAKKIMSVLAKPKMAATIAMLGGTGFFSLFGMFSTYKNDGVTRNDPPLKCIEGTFDLPSGGEESENDIQENVNIMYDIFVTKMGYSENFLIGMVSCMMVESTADPDRLESDYILTGPKASFDSTAGPGKAVGTSVTQTAFDAYASAFRSGGGWNGNSAYLADGKMTCGIGLVQWTGGRALELIKGLDVVNMDYSVMDLPYQCAFLLAEFKTNYTDLAPDGSWSGQCGSAESATSFFFKTFVSGGSLKDVDKRLAYVSEVTGYVQTAAANNKYTSDVVTMAELLSNDSFSGGVASAQDVQLCVNGTMVRTSSIAMAAASISWLERGDYEDENGAYGTYRRAARAPLIINDWNFLDGKDGADGGTMETHKKDTYADGSDYYVVEGASGCSGGKHDLIACTEFYYYSHMVAFPKETGKGSNAGYFSSCDRGTATAVRIAGADDLFPAGNPKNQLSYALGAGPGDRSGQHNAEEQPLWEPTGFLRGCDYYSLGGSTTIPAGNIMISWSNQAANGLISEGSGSVDGDGETEFEELEDGDMVLANLRFPLANTNSTRHIITFIGEGTVQAYWGNEFLFQQYRNFDDTDSLIRGDLTIDAPKEMTDGASFKSKTASKGGDQKTTFYMEQNEHAKDHDDLKEDEMTERQIEYNAKTGLPEFKSWEQIFVRLIHNTDDDASRGESSVSNEKDLYITYETDKDNYLDDSDEEDHIEQYGKDGQDGTNSNKYFYEDWNTVGQGEIKSDGEGDYEDPGSADTLWWDDGSDEWTNEWKNGNNNGYWRYEYVTDVEYRMNQLMRFGLASMMCSYASEEDASVYQNGGDEASNETGHILGNVYRRMSRISDEIDKSGRYYYFNTVVSNDMLQDLVQLYSFEGNGEDEETHVDDNFGPVYDIADWYATAKSKNIMWADRRYGLTASDVDELMAGFAGFTMGSGDGFTEKFNEYVYTPMYKLDEDWHLALYDYETDATEEGNTDGRGTHETSHEPNETDKVYKQEVYGLNPFLVFDKYLERDLNGLPEKNLISEDGYRSDKVTGDETDNRLAFIDRHYQSDGNGNINMFAYSVLGMTPSLGKETHENYEEELKNVKTLEATETSGTGEHPGIMNADNLRNSWGELRYTDYTYAETKAGNTDMAKRLYKNDDRDGDGKRDDYNRREYTVIPYYHTHTQKCVHSDEEKCYYELSCDWYNDDWKTPLDVNKIDSQAHLNQNCKDLLDTISFENNVNLRGKYTGLNVLPLSYGTPRYYIMESGTPKDITEEKPPIHQGCSGYSAPQATDILGIPIPGVYETCEVCGANGTSSCTHSCEELQQLGKHDLATHTECMAGCDCHDKYGCNAAEYYFHNGTRVYMVLQVTDEPKEVWGVDITIDDFVVGGEIKCDKANLLQQVIFDANGFVDDTYVDALDSMGHPVYGLQSFESPKMAGKKDVYDSATMTPAYGEGDLIGYFTIEGDIISDQDAAMLGETVKESNKCVGEDLHRVESIRNRVGAGKAAAGVTQNANFVTGLSGIKYDNNSYGENGVYGEVMITGTQHKDPATPDYGNYGDWKNGGSGPDCAYGNDKTHFGNSLLREILGDEHVFHIRFGSQDEDMVTGGDPRCDFKFYKEFGDFDNDAKYKDRYTFELTDQYYSKFATEDEIESKADVTIPDHANIPLPAAEKNGSGKSDPKHSAGPWPGTSKVAWKEDEEIHGQNKGQNGDYGLWVTHASRGTRGMKTEYYVFKNVFGDVYDGDYDSKTSQYMVFGNVTKQDEADKDGDGEKEESFIYGMGNQVGAKAGGTNVESTTVYGQAGNSHWKRMIDIYNAAMSETRHFD